MTRYLIDNIKFNAKSDITEHVREIIRKNTNTKIFGDDLKFMLELFQYHPHQEKFLYCSSIFVRDSSKGRNQCFFIEYLDGTSDDVSWTKCVANIPSNEDNTTIVTVDDWTFPFGKYNGKLLYDVFHYDRNYFDWLYKRDVKGKLKKLMTGLINNGIPKNVTVSDDFQFIDTRNVEKIIDESKTKDIPTNDGGGVLKQEKRLNEKHIRFNSFSSEHNLGSLQFIDYLEIHGKKGLETYSNYLSSLKYNNLDGYGDNIELMKVDLP
jgi:uncharacterized protein (DUF3820 family)